MWWATFSVDGFSPLENGGTSLRLWLCRGVDDRTEQALKLVEIHDGADGIQLGSGDGDADSPVVAVEGFKGAIVQSELVGGGEFAGDGNVESHGREL